MKRTRAMPDGGLACPFYFLSARNKECVNRMLQIDFFGGSNYGK